MIPSSVKCLPFNLYFPYFWLYSPKGAFFLIHQITFQIIYTKSLTQALIKTKTKTMSAIQDTKSFRSLWKSQLKMFIRKLEINYCYLKVLKFCIVLFIVYLKVDFMKVESRKVVTRSWGSRKTEQQGEVGEQVLSQCNLSMKVSGVLLLTKRATANGDVCTFQKASKDFGSFYHKEMRKF